MEYYISAKEKNHIYTNNFTIYSLNIYKCSKLYYNYDNKNTTPNYIKLGAFIYYDDFDKIPEVKKRILTDKERKIIIDKLDKLQNNSYIMSELEALKWTDWEMSSIYNTGKNKGTEEGKKDGQKTRLEEGRKQTTIETIKIC